MFFKNTVVICFCEKFSSVVFFNKSFLKDILEEIYSKKVCKILKINEFKIFCVNCGSALENIVVNINETVKSIVRCS